MKDLQFFLNKIKDRRDREFITKLPNVSGARIENYWSSLDDGKVHQITKVYEATGTKIYIDDVLQEEGFELETGRVKKRKKRSSGKRRRIRRK